jgi:hypothetical protein
MKYLTKKTGSQTKTKKEIFKNFIQPIIIYFVHYFRMFYLKTFTLDCTKCKHTFFYVYFDCVRISCPNCQQEYCKYCTEIHRQNDYAHDFNKRCYYRYTIIYILGVGSLLLAYLKLVFVFTTHYFSKYLTVGFFIIEYIAYNEKASEDSIMLAFIKFKNMILAVILIMYFEEKDILFYIIVGFLQLVFIIIINMLKDIILRKLQSSSRAIKRLFFKTRSMNDRKTIINSYAQLN